MTFQKAVRKQVKLKIALTGPSGAGKTFSALLIASGIGKRIAVIDTENKSASLYAGMSKGPLAGIDFDILEIEPDYTIQKYAEAIEAAEKAGYDVLIVDSISHAWAGEGGLLAKKEALDQRGGNSYTNWAGITKEHEAFKAKILNANIHLICTMRSKQDYVLEMNDKGKSAPKKVGLAPIQRDGMEYEFTTVFDLAMDHNAKVSKDRTDLFDGMIFKPTKETGEQLMKWLMSGKPASTSPVDMPAVAKASPKGKAQEEKPKEAPAGPGYDFSADSQAHKDQLAAIRNGVGVIVAHGITESLAWDGLRKRLQKVSGHSFAEATELTTKEADDIIGYLAAWDKNIKDKKAKAAVAANAGKGA